MRITDLMAIRDLTTKALLENLNDEISTRWNKDKYIRGIQHHLENLEKL